MSNTRIMMIFIQITLILSQLYIKKWRETCKTKLHNECYYSIIHWSLHCKNAKMDVISSIFVATAVACILLVKHK